MIPTESHSPSQFPVFAKMSVFIPIDNQDNAHTVFLITYAVVFNLYRNVHVR